MAPEDLQQLKAELTTLRQENQRLRQAKTIISAEGVPLQELPEAIPPDTLLPTLVRQLDQLQEANAQFKTAVDLFDEVQRSLGTLIPALEVQFTGWTNEIYHLRTAQNDAEQAYASVVSRLETQLNNLKARANEPRSADLAQQLLTTQQEREQLQRRVGELEQALHTKQENVVRPAEQDSDPSHSSQGDMQGPFTSLNIFDI